MVRVQSIHDKIEWENLIKDFPYFEPFICYEWGAYKQKFSWEVKRIAFYEHQNFLGLTQCFYKRKFGVIISWNSGGLLFKDSSKLRDIILAFQAHFKDFIFLHRFNFYQQHNAKDSFFLHQYFKKAKRKITSPYTYIHKLPQRTLNSNHRYYLKQSKKHPLSITYGNSNQDLLYFYETYMEMIKNKKLSHIQTSQQELQELVNAFNENIIIANVLLENQCIASCIILISLDRAFYYLASSTEQGRKVCASYFMIDSLFDYLYNRGIKYFNFGGITPFNQSAFGVNRFKQGFGGELTQYLGEYEITNSKIFSWFFNSIILGRI